MQALVTITGKATVLIKKVEMSIIAIRPRGGNNDKFYQSLLNVLRQKYRVGL